MKNNTSIDEFKRLISNPEGLNVEFKEAKNQFSKDKNLPDYCAALANEKGGKLILGINHRGDVVGTKAFMGTLQKIPHELLNKIKIRIDVEELFCNKKRVLIFHVPSRLSGQLIKSTGSYKYPMRVGESLVEMNESKLKEILNETSPDFTKQIVNNLTLSDLDDNALLNFKKRWAQKAQRDDYLSFQNDKLLKSINLLTDVGLNYASLILFGKKEIIDEKMPGCEIIFEWRQESRKTSYDYRTNWREAFFSIHDKIWETINARNLRIPFQDGLFQREVYAFSEKSIREAILNAIAHRDYSIHEQSIFIKASPEEFIIESPGGYPPGITTENILYKSYWRNRCISETLEKAGLVERSGQGMDDIFENTIKEGKGMPDLSKSDEISVKLKIPAQVKDKEFILFLEQLINSKQISFSFEEIYELEKIREKQMVHGSKFKDKFLDLGIIEKIGKTSGAKYILSHQYYAHKGRSGIYTRLTGISRKKQKELILIHIKKNKKGYLKDLLDIFPELKAKDVSNLLQELKRNKIILHKGSAKTGYWELLK